MQMNRWLTPIEPEDEEDSYHPVRPRASVWIDPLAQQNISASYIAKEQKERRAIPNPQTPIPARASSPQGAHTVKVRPRYTQNITQTRDSDITQMPTLPQSPQPTMWQYELPDYEAESSLSALSLAYPESVGVQALDELDTLPPPQSRTTEDIAEIDTLIPPRQHSPIVQNSPVIPEREKGNVSSFTLPFAQPVGPQRQKSVTLPAPYAVGESANASPGTATVAVPQMPIGNQKLDFLARVHASSTVVKGNSSYLAEDGVSWTTGRGKGSLMAKRIASRPRRKRIPSLNPIDRLRWWLLIPGRIEFLLWLSGTVVLVGVTCMLLFATLLSTGWSNASLSSIGGGTTSSSPDSKTATGKASCTAANAKSPQCHSTTIVSSTGLQLTLVDNAQLLPGMPIYVHGQGFTPNNTVNFTYDASLPCHPNTISTDTQGTFSLYLMLGTGAKAGVHQINAYDVATKHAVTVNVTISSLPIGKTVSPSPTHTTPATTPTTTSGGGVLPTPVGQTPVPVTPTVDTTPTEVPTQQPTPTIEVTQSPTTGVTPTVGVTGTVAPRVTPTVGTQGTQGTDAASVLKNALYEQHADGHTSFSIWLWIAILGYSLSMTLLGCAGLLYRRNRRISAR